MKELSKKGGETNKHTEVRLSVNDIDLRKLNRIKKHYGFKNNQEVISALIKRAIMSIDTGA